MNVLGIDRFFDATPFFGPAKAALRKLGLDRARLAGMVAFVPLSAMVAGGAEISIDPSIAVPRHDGWHSSIHAPPPPVAAPRSDGLAPDGIAEALGLGVEAEHASWEAAMCYLKDQGADVGALMSQATAAIAGLTPDRKSWTAADPWEADET